MKLTENVIKFSQAHGIESLIEKFCDYYNQYRAEVEGVKGLNYKTTGIKEGKEVAITFSDKEESLNKEFRDTIYRLAGVQNTNILPEVAWSMHPLVNFYTFSIVSTMVDAVLPDSLITSLSAYTDVRTIGFGDSSVFNIEPRDLFVVSKAGRGKKTAELQKQFTGQPVAIIPENHMLSVSVSLYRVLSGAESLARFASKAIRAIETDVALSAYSAFNTAMLALSSTPGNGQLKAAGWSQDTFVNFAQKVTAWNGGAKAIALGTQRAMQQVLPDDANYRYDLSSDYVKLGYIKNFFGFDGIVLPQVADWTSPFGLSLNDDAIYIISPSAQKPVKLVLEGQTLSYTNGQFDAANLTQNTTFQKSYGVGIATNAIAACITV